MKEYYASKSKLLILPVAGALPLIFIFATFNLANIATVIIPLLMLGFIGFISYLHIKRISRPILIIQDSKITLTTKFFKTKVINDLKQSKLIISNDFIAFRESEKQDISVSKDDFPKNTWATLLTDLETLPFKGVVK